MIFGKSVLIVAKFAKKNYKIGHNAQNEPIFLHILPQKPKTVEIWKLTETELLV